jgi:hypothetical protein
MNLGAIGNAGEWLNSLVRKVIQRERIRQMRHCDVDLGCCDRVWSEFVGHMWSCLKAASKIVDRAGSRDQGMRMEVTANVRGDRQSTIFHRSAWPSDPLGSITI